jgi:peptidyl-prolyl cis-trans isomerase C
MRIGLNKKCLVLLVCLALSPMSIAQGSKKLAAGAVATVNGVAISDKAFDEIIKSIVSQGQADTPELRKTILDELIARELFVQESTKLGLDKTPEAKEQFSQIHQNFLMDLLVNNYLKSHPITDSDMRSEYDRQIAAIGDAQEYSLKQIVVSTEADAKAIIAALKKGDNFESLARDKSIDPSKSQGGNLGWVLSKQIIPPIANVIANMNKGTVSSSPIQTSAGWHVVKVEDVRPFKAPSFDESKQRLQQALLQNKRMELLKSLKESAKIVQ